MNRSSSRRAIALAAVLILITLPALEQTARTSRHSPKAAPDDPVDLNDASEAELKAVPGITARTARKIVEGRPYSSISDLSSAGISAATIKRISKNVTVDRKRKGLAGRQTAAGGGPDMVWVSSDTNVYHLPGDKWYGKTKNGKYMSEADAIAAGYRAARRK